MLALNACGGPALTREPASPVDLAGDWALDRAASDDAERIVRAALPTPRLPRTVPPGERASPESGGGARESGGAVRGDEERDGGGLARAPGGGALAFLREFVVPAEQLALQPGPRGTFTIVQGARARTHELGTDSPPAVTDRFGSRVVRAGWDGRALVVESDGGQRFRLVETFRAGAAPGTLAYRVELRARGLRKIELDAQYRRATASPAPRAPLEGPPAPAR